MQQSTLKLRRDVKIHTPGEPVAGELIDPQPAKPIPNIDATPPGLPDIDSIDVTKLTKPVLTKQGWLVPEFLRPGGA